MVVMCVTVSTIMIMMICSVSVTGKVSQYHSGVVNVMLKLMLFTYIPVYVCKSTYYSIECHTCTLVSVSGKACECKLQCV